MLVQLFQYVIAAVSGFSLGLLANREDEVLHWFRSIHLTKFSVSLHYTEIRDQAFQRARELGERREEFERTGLDPEAQFTLV